MKWLLRHLMLVLAVLAPTPTLAATSADLKAATDDTVFYAPEDDCAGITNGTGGGPLNGDNNAIRAYNFFIGKGLTPAQASGIVGNMIEESGVGPERLQGTPGSQVTTAQQMVSTGLYQAAGVGWGIVQWTPADQAASGVIITTTNPGPEVNTLGYQLSALWTEINGPEKAALDLLKTATNPVTAADDWLSGFERGDPNVLREIAANAIYNYEVNHAALPQEILDMIVPESAANPGTATSGGSDVGLCGTGTPTGPSGCKDPFRGVEGKPGWAPERVDQGVDYAGSGPIYAVCSGTILNTINSGWDYGGYDAYISIKIDSGPYKGLVSYMAEACPPTVKVGDHVTPDTVICNIIGGGTGIETGWSAPAGTGQPIAQLYGGDGCCTTTAGISYNNFLKSLGTPSGVITNTPPIGNPLPKPPYP